MFAALRIRGRVGVSVRKKDTMDKLLLKKKHTLVFLPETKDIEGMLQKAKDYITYGKIEDKEVEDFFKLKGLKASDAKALIKGGKENKVFHLSPPKRGFKGSIKKHGKKGALGKREKMFELISRMV